jgi:hypothetical protein
MTRKLAVAATTLTLVATFMSFSALSAPASASTVWNAGDVFAGVGGGKYNVYDNAGTFKETIDQAIGSGETTGCAFNPARTKLYTTNFQNDMVAVFDDTDPHAVLHTFSTGPMSNESVVFDAAGNYYVGHADGDRDIEKYDSSDNLVATYDVVTGPRGTDWVELAADQSTIFYTSEGSTIRRFDTATSTQLPDFSTALNQSFGLRLLPPGDGSGGLLVANFGDVKRLDASGTVVQSYDAPGEDSWFALNLDPNGTSFWSAGIFSGNFYRFNIASGALEVGPISTGSSVAGLCLKGEPTAGTPDISLAKTANPTTYSSVGDVIIYTYEITNSGLTTLSGPFSISDDKQGTISPCGSGPLAPGGSTTCTSAHTISQVDLNAGSITNVATASGDGATSNQATATVTAQVGTTPRLLKQDAVATLQALLPTGDPDADMKINRAIHEVGESLAPQLWVDGSHLTDLGRRVFHEEKESARALTRIVNPPAGVAGVIDSLVAADRALARIAVDEATAAGGDPAILSDAEEQMQKGDEEAANGHMPEAIKHYGRAWKKAQLSLI